MKISTITIFQVKKIIWYIYFKHRGNFPKQQVDRMNASNAKGRAQKTRSYAADTHFQIEMWVTL